MARIIGWREDENGEIVPVMDETLPDPSPRVGIFFFVGDKILMDAVPAEKGEPYGEAMQHGNHFEFWKKLTPRSVTERKFRSRAYNAYPRGRVVYFPEKNKYCIYYDSCLEVDDEIIIVTEKFELIGVNIELSYDEHYKCAKCNPIL